MVRVVEWLLLVIMVWQMEGDMVVAILGKFFFYYILCLCILFSGLFLFSGAGDLVGCDLEDQLANPQRNVINRSGFLVKALTYCELKAIQLDHVDDSVVTFSADDLRGIDISNTIQNRTWLPKHHGDISLVISLTQKTFVP